MLGQCPIWGTECDSITQAEDSVIVADSPRAGGSYQLYDDAVTELGNLTHAEKARLTTLLMRQRQLGNIRPPVNVSIIIAAKSVGKARMEERLTNLLKFMAENTPRAGLPSVNFGPDPSKYENSNIMLIGTKNGSENDSWYSTQVALAHSESLDFEELDYLTDSLSKRGLIEKGDSPRTKYGMYQSSLGGYLCIVTTDGYIEFEQRQTEVRSDQCFVAMWFNEATDALYDRAIAPAVKAAGYQPLRIDQKPDFLGKIDDQIIAEIRRSRFVIADFTHGDGGARGSVYYEVGFAQGLDLPVIFTCRDDQLDDLHFDTNHFLHLSWPSRHAEALIEPLKNRILANLGAGPHADGE